MHISCNLAMLISICYDFDFRLLLVSVRVRVYCCGCGVRNWEIHIQLRRLFINCIGITLCR